MTAIADLVRFVAPEVSRAPAPIIEDALLWSATEFCRESKYWRFVYDKVLTFKNIKEYEIDDRLPADSQIETIEDPIIHDEREVYQKSRQWLNTHMPDWIDETDSEPDYALITDTNPWKIRLVPYPNRHNNTGMTVVCVLKPSASATTIPELLYNEWFEELAAGAKARLLVRPAVAWSNPELGAYYRQVFADGIRRGRSKAWSGYKTEDRNNRVTGHYF